MPPQNAPDRLTTPSAEAVERFRNDVMRLVRRAFDTTGVIDRFDLALAVSGGPDSMAMLALAASAFPGRAICATVDHGLREGSDREAAMVAQVCATIGVPHETLHPSEAIAGSSLQMRARRARYAALSEWVGRNDVYPLLTAHHADDQAETLLMRLNRASGLSGLSGIRPYRREGELMMVRPLLGWRRAELRAVVEDCGWPFVDDPSNADARYDRSGMRKFLADHPGLNARSLAASAAFLAEAEEAIARSVELLWSERWRSDRLALDGLPREYQRRLVRRAIDAVRRREAIALPTFSEASNVEPLLDAIALGRGAVQGGVMMQRIDDSWHFGPAPTRRTR